MSCGGIPEEVAKQIEWLEEGQGLCSTVAQQRCQIAVGNLQESTDPTRTELVRSVGFKAYSCQPLGARGRFLGTFSFGSRTRSSLTPDEIALMQAVGDLMAVAIERAGLIASLLQQTEQLREANRLKDEFLGVVCHKLRTPLTAMLGWARMPPTQKLNQALMGHALATIERNAVRQSELIEDLLDVSRIITGKLRLEVEQVDLAAVMQAAADTVRPTAEAKGIEIHTVLECEFCPVSGAPVRLQQIVWNLLSNAIKFTQALGRVRVGLSVGMGHREWGMGHRASGIGQNNQSPIPNSQSPIPNPQCEPASVPKLRSATPAQESLQTFCLSFSSASAKLTPLGPGPTADWDWGWQLCATEPNCTGELSQSPVREWVWGRRLR